MAGKMTLAEASKIPVGSRLRPRSGTGEEYVTVGPMLCLRFPCVAVNSRGVAAPEMPLMWVRVELVMDGYLAVTP